MPRGRDGEACEWDEADGAWREPAAVRGTLVAFGEDAFGDVAEARDAAKAELDALAAQMSASVRASQEAIDADVDESMDDATREAHLTVLTRWRISKLARSAPFLQRT